MLWLFNIIWPLFNPLNPVPNLHSVLSIKNWVGYPVPRPSAEPPGSGLWGGTCRRSPPPQRWDPQAPSPSGSCSQQIYVAAAWYTVIFVIKCQVEFNIAPSCTQEGTVHTVYSKLPPLPPKKYLSWTRKLSLSEAEDPRMTLFFGWNSCRISVQKN